MYKGAILNIQKNSNKASSCPDIYNNNSTLTVNSEPDSVSLFSYVENMLGSTVVLDPIGVYYVSVDPELGS